MVYTGQIPLEGDFLFPQRASMIGLAKLSEAVLGTQPVVDGLTILPTSPPSLAISVAPGQIYASAAIDSLAYGAMPADPGHQIVKQGVQLDARTLAISPPGSAGFSQWFLIQAAFQEAEDGAVVLPYYNSANPSEAWSGPGNSGQQQFTRRLGVVTLQIKAGVPAPTGSHVQPQPDPGWTGLGWVTVAAGQTSIQTQHIAPFTAANRIPLKLPQLVKAVSASVTMLSAARQLRAEEAGVVVIDITNMPAGAEVRLPAAGAVPGVPLRFRILGRALTPPSRRDYGWVKIIPGSAGDILDESFAYCGPNDSVELVSDGASRWYWVSGFGAYFYAGYVAADVVLPHNVQTLIPWTAPTADLLPVWKQAEFPTRIYIPKLGRYSVTGNIAFYPPAAGTPISRTRLAQLYINGGTGGSMFALSNEGVDHIDGHVVSFVSGPLGLHAGDFLEVVVLQNSGTALSMQPFATWISVKAEIA